MIKFVVSENEFFKDWTDKINGIRITFHKYEKGFYKYEVQRFDGKSWEKMRAFHTLKEAKSFCNETI